MSLYGYDDGNEHAFTCPIIHLVNDSVVHLVFMNSLQSLLPFNTKFDKISFNFSLSFDDNACSHLVDQDLEGALKALESEGDLDPREVAIVKFTPSDTNPNADFADEVYYPPIEETRAHELNALRETILPSNAIEGKWMNHQRMKASVKT